MADDQNNNIEGRAPDPFVAARINDPAAPTPASFELAGLLGDSDRDGYRRLYLNTSLDYYVEFRTGDVLAVDSVQPDQPPFVGLDATRVTLNRDAQVEYVHSRPAVAADAFNVEAQAALPGGFTPDTVDTATLPTDLTIQTPGCVPRTVFVQDCLRTIQTCWTCGTQCLTRNNTCWQTCDTCFGGTCQTCDQVTCATCASCLTCDGATCQTCNNQLTCHTCQPGKCWRTLVTCPTGCGVCITRQPPCVTHNACASQLVPCVTQDRCPTLVCP